MNKPDKCPSCGHRAGAPYRRSVGDKIIEGCVDKFHNGALPTPSETSYWHNRPEAKHIRKGGVLHNVGRVG